MRREKLNFGRERQDLRRVVCNWESSRSPNLPRALWIFATLGFTETTLSKGGTKETKAGAGDRDVVRKEVTAKMPQSYKGDWNFPLDSLDDRLKSESKTQGAKGSPC